jgi:hypothetical protein
MLRSHVPFRSDILDGFYRVPALRRRVPGGVGTETYFLNDRTETRFSKVPGYQGLRNLPPLLCVPLHEQDFVLELCSCETQAFH